MNKRILLVLIAWWSWSIPCLAQVSADVVVVFDNSGSMRTNDPQVLAKDAARRFIADLDSGYRIGLVLFDQRVDLAVPLATSDAARPNALAAGIDRINYRGQRTDIPAALERAVGELKSSARADASKVIVFLTDGIVDTGNPAQDADRARWVREDLARNAARDGIRIYAIAFTAQADRALTQSLAEATGGAYFHSVNADGLSHAFSSIANALRALQPQRATEPVREESVAPPAIPVAVPAATTPASSEPMPVAPSPTNVPSEALSAATGPATMSPETAVAEPVESGEGEFGVDDLTEEERAALQEAGVDVEEMFAAEPGKAIIIPPKQKENRSGMIGMLILAAVAGALLLGVGLWLRSRRGSGGAVTRIAGHESAVPQARLEVRLRDVETVTGRDSVVIGDKPLMIGRVQGNDANLDYLVVDRPTVGRRHALITRRGSQYWVADQGSVNGTYLNDERVSGERPLRHGDELRLHKYVFEFDAPGLVPAPNEAESHGEATIVASAATLVGAAAAVAPHVDRIGDTGIVAAGNLAADDHWFADSGISSPPVTAPVSAPSVIPVASGMLPTHRIGNDVDASVFFDDMSGPGFERESAEGAAHAQPPIGASASDGLLLETVITSDNTVTDPFGEFPSQLSDAGPPTVEHDLSATPFLATSVLDKSGHPQRPFADLDNAMARSEAEDDSPPTVRLKQFNPDLTVTDDDFDLFDVTGAGDDTLEGTIAPDRSGSSGGDRERE